MLYKTTRSSSDTNFENKNYLIDKSLLSSEENGFVTEDRLTCVLEVDYFVEIKDNKLQSNAGESLQNSPNDLKSCFTQLFETKQCSDVILNVGECAIKAHKVVLIARSPVFAAMFQHDMQEHQLNSITISDIGPEVIEAMLRYLYTDDIPNLGEMADLLLEAADKYAIPNLKLKCEESLISSITIDNATCTLMLADRHNAENLKEEAVEFITDNPSSVMETKDWQEMIQIGGNAHLVGEAFRVLALKYDG